MSDTLHNDEILNNTIRLGGYPLEKLKRVDKPTILITENIIRPDEREHGFNRAKRGDYGPVAAREQKRPSKYPLGAAIGGMSRYLASVVDGETASAKAPIPENPEIITRHIKRLGYFLRADIIGICELPNYAIYNYDIEGNPVNLNHKYAICIIVDQEYDTMSASTGYDWISTSQSTRSYSATAFISCIMADYIRRLGYPARAHHQRDYQVVVPPLLLLSGLGEMSRMGNTVLNPFLGGRFKAGVVTTDLPLVTDKPIDFGLQEFCRVCNKCAIECPAKAISMDDKVIYNGYECWKLDVKRCAKFRITNPHGSSCGRCIKVCPWNKPRGWMHDAVRWIIQHTPTFNKTIMNIDTLMGYSKQDANKKWWFDLELVNGILHRPKD